ncbi:hypothetical protein [Salinigranum halophilum]|jgi:hypothetical protein|uniref:hypothetical protein n=1 Tax=Salinigranum halophilum TaxID=2565931 RepID=UPI00191C6B26|nr:hypothetical protein [Salinigranum halophilum]
MEFDTVWRELRDRGETLGPDEVLVTPGSERPFDCVTAETDRIVVEFVREGAERSLWRDQFQVLFDRLETDADGVSLTDLPAGVEPYVAVMSLSSRYGVDDAGGRFHRAGTSASAESPFRRPAWTARTSAERVRDDAVLLADALEREHVDDPRSVEPASLVDLYVLLSDVQHGADRLRRELGDLLLNYIGPDARLHGRFGSVHRTTRERRRLKDEEAVFDALDERGIPHSWVTGIDTEKLDVVIAVTDLEERAVYDVDEQVYVQKTAVEEGEKQSRLQGLMDRLAGVETEEAAELRADIRAIEDRIDAVVTAG